ncbi:UDP-D-xylose:L-fucose alpha-1,3-D-xylosyltransferase 3 [Porphyridium purpureum]|uniref:UDP-D-xylose:L-fucose alpha-1,3-D-xylosyltransferase 3 n=1 Tax=Porphyridium purpureum TaxID=35688 RepID=A0A5J4Z7N8_PORPP|nr:UDP-D-xylose:L-fucose alpha-1,3-D-xylosyltransferase 3 [Porphyridium purpureum]|eukprot:POR5296..scf295_1
MSLLRVRVLRSENCGADEGGATPDGDASPAHLSLAAAARGNAMLGSSNSSSGNICGNAGSSHAGTSSGISWQQVVRSKLARARRWCAQHWIIWLPPKASSPSPGSNGNEQPPVFSLWLVLLLSLAACGVMYALALRIAMPVLSRESLENELKFILDRPRVYKRSMDQSSVSFRSLANAFDSQLSTDAYRDSFCSSSERLVITTTITPSIRRLERLYWELDRIVQAAQANFSVIGVATPLQQNVSVDIEVWVTYDSSGARDAIPVFMREALRVPWRNGIRILKLLPPDYNAGVAWVEMYTPQSVYGNLRDALCSRSKSTAASGSSGAGSSHEKGFLARVDRRLLFLRSDAVTLSPALIAWVESAFASRAELARGFAFSELWITADHVDTSYTSQFSPSCKYEFFVVDVAAAIDGTTVPLQCHIWRLNEKYRWFNLQTLAVHADSWDQFHRFYHMNAPNAMLWHRNGSRGIRLAKGASFRTLFRFLEEFAHSFEVGLISLFDPLGARLLLTRADSVLQEPLFPLNAPVLGALSQALALGNVRLIENQVANAALDLTGTAMSKSSDTMLRCRHGIKHFTMNTNLAEFSHRHNNSVVLSLVSRSFLGMLNSWHCNTAGHQWTLPGLVLLAYGDAQFLSLLRRSYPHALIVDISEREEVGETSVETEERKFGTWSYWRLMHRRAVVVRTLVNMGISVLLFDLDQVWLQNPLPNLVDMHRQSKCDVIGALNSRNEIGGNFLFFSGSSQSALVAGLVASKFESALAVARARMKTEPHPSRRIDVENDQSIISRILTQTLSSRFESVFAWLFRKASFPPLYWLLADTTRFCALPVGTVVDGTWYTNSKAQHAFERPVVVNNNFIIGLDAKISRAKSFRHWFVADDNTTCLNS